MRENAFRAKRAEGGHDPAKPIITFSEAEFTVLNHDRPSGEL